MTAKDHKIAHLADMLAANKKRCNDLMNGDRSPDYIWGRIKEINKENTKIKKQIEELRNEKK